MQDLDHLDIESLDLELIARGRQYLDLPRLHSLSNAESMYLGLHRNIYIR